MDEHGLPIVGAGVDYTKVPALEHKTTLTFINKYIVHTSQFLNKFSCVCEERLSELTRRIQRLDISLSILEAKLSSIPDLEGVQATRQYEAPANVAAAGGPSAAAAGGGATSTSAQPTTAAPASGPPLPSSQQPSSSEPIPPPQAAPQAEGSQRKKVKDDPRYQKYFKMKRLGVNPLQIAMNMKRDGLNPDVLDDEDADLPDEDGAGGGGGGGLTMKGGSDSSDSEESDSDNSSEPSEQDSDDSEGYD